ncbi:hypothetical protein HAX54_025282 [Datura stramonium]|uniref:Uncharacterized protein n=1 Tax=Datura stramonium TaxID=4076 RepID=A0ABS8S7H8_DATST|nr:hypothetical protein [Datura stramonium]
MRPQLHLTPPLGDYYPCLSDSGVYIAPPPLFDPNSPSFLIKWSETSTSYKGTLEPSCRWLWEAQGRKNFFVELHVEPTEVKP